MRSSTQQPALGCFGSCCHSATVLLLCLLHPEVVVQSCTPCHVSLTQLKDASCRVVLMRLSSLSLLLLQVLSTCCAM